MCSDRTERKKKEIGIEVITYIAITPNPLPPIREKKTSQSCQAQSDRKA